MLEGWERQHLRETVSLTWPSNERELKREYVFLFEIKSHLILSVCSTQISSLQHWQENTQSAKSLLSIDLKGSCGRNPVEPHGIQGLPLTAIRYGSCSPTATPPPVLGAQVILAKPQWEQSTAVLALYWLELEGLLIISVFKNAAFVSTTNAIFSQSPLLCLKLVHELPLEFYFSKPNEVRSLAFSFSILFPSYVCGSQISKKFYIHLLVSWNLPSLRQENFGLNWAIISINWEMYGSPYKSVWHIVNTK